MAKIKVTPEKELLIGLIVSDRFIQQLAPIIQLEYLQASSSRIIARWCLDYYKQYGCAPNIMIQDIYKQHLRTLTEEDSEMIARVLSHVSKEYANKDKYNVPYMIEQATRYLRERRADMLREKLDNFLLKGEIEKAENAILNYTKLSVRERQITNMWKDSQTISEIFNQESSKLFKMPGIIGEYMGSFRRSNLYAYAGVAKRGKSRWLAQTASIASMLRLNTVYFSLEMDKEETTQMIMNTMLRKPIRDTVQDVRVRLPYFTEDNDILYDEKIIKSATEADYQKWRRKADMLCSPLHRIIGEPYKMTLEDIENELLALEYYEGFIPDVIIIDYANLLKANGFDNRDKVNTIWTGLKALAKHWHCAVITASHMNTEALKKDGENYNIGEDRRILNHVSGMYILNQSEEEKQAGIMRIKATATRFGQYTEADQVVCLYDYDTGRTLIDSRWMRDVPEYSE